MPYTQDEVKAYPDGLKYFKGFDDAIITGLYKEENFQLGNEVGDIVELAAYPKFINGERNEDYIDPKEFL